MQLQALDWGIMVVIGLVALMLDDALQTFNILLSVGAGTGLLFLLRWYWSRINAWSEIAAMVVSLVVAIGIEFSLFVTLPSWLKMCAAVSITAAGWLIVTLLTPRTDESVLKGFHDRVRPPGPGWARFRASEAAREESRGQIGTAFFCTIAGCIMVYSMLFSVGEWLRGDHLIAMMLLGIAVLASGGVLYVTWGRIKFDDNPQGEPEFLPVATTPAVEAAQ